MNQTKGTGGEVEVLLLEGQGYLQLYKGLFSPGTKIGLFLSDSKWTPLCIGGLGNACVYMTTFFSSTPKCVLGPMDRLPNQLMLSA